MKRQLKIALFTDAYYPMVNGVVTSISLLREELIKLGHIVYVITVDSPKNDIEDNEYIIRFPSIPFNKWKEFRIGIPISTKAYKKIKSLDIDIIHSHTEFSIGLMSKYFSKKFKIPHIHTYHTMYEDYTHYIYSPSIGQGVFKSIVRNTIRKFLKNMDRIIAPSLKTKNSLLSYGVKNEINIVPTGIDIKSFDKIEQRDKRIIELKNKLGIGEYSKIILYLGRVSQEKSIDVIVDSCEMVFNEIEDSKLLIVGDGPNKKELEKKVNEKKLHNKVIFTGQIPFENVALYYSLANVFVNASKTETQGLTILEAMASNIPIVVYDDLNISGIVEDGKSGRLFKEKKQMSKQIISALNDEKLNKRLTEGALESVDNLSKEKFAQNVEKIYLSLLDF